MLSDSRLITSIQEGLEQDGRRMSTMLFLWAGDHDQDIQV